MSEILTKEEVEILTNKLIEYQKSLPTKEYAVNLYEEFRKWYKSLRTSQWLFYSREELMFQAFMQGTHYNTSEEISIEQVKEFFDRTSFMNMVAEELKNPTKEKLNGSEIVEVEDITIESLANECADVVKCIAFPDRCDECLKAIKSKKEEINLCELISDNARV